MQETGLALRGVELDAGQRAKVEAILGLDFRLMIINVTTGWYGEAPEMSMTDALDGVRQFRMFLVGRLLGIFPSLVPSRKADAIWHAWMNEPTKYAAETTEVFGAILPHYGHLGHIGEEGRIRRQAGWANMIRLARDNFCVDMSAEGAGTWCDHGIIGDVVLDDDAIEQALARILAGDVTVPA